MTKKIRLFAMLTFILMLTSSAKVASVGPSLDTPVSPKSDIGTESTTSDGHELVYHDPITFDELEDGIQIGSYYNGVVFSDGYTVWHPNDANQEFYPTYNNTTANAYSPEEFNAINFTNPVAYYSAFYSNNLNTEMTVYAYDAYDNEIGSSVVEPKSKNAFVEISTAGDLISRIRVVATSYGFQTVDQITLGEIDTSLYTTSEIDFDELEDTIQIGSYYDGVVFSDGFHVWHPTDSSKIAYPTYNDSVAHAYSQEEFNAINFTHPKAYYSAYYSNNLNTEMTVYAYDAADNEIGSVVVEPQAENAFVEISTDGDLISRIRIVGGSYTSWTLDHITIGELDLSFLHNSTVIDFDELSSGTYVGNNYAGANFSDGFTVWHPIQTNNYPTYNDSVANAYSQEEFNAINFTRSVTYFSAYYTTDLSSNMTVYAYDQYDNIIGSEIVEANAKNNHVSFQSPDTVIHRIRIVGASYNLWTIDHITFGLVTETTAPEVTDISIPESFVVNTTGNIAEFRVHDVIPGDVYVSLHADGNVEVLHNSSWTDGELIEINLDAIPDGNYIINIEVTDVFGNSFSEQYSLEVLPVDDTSQIDDTSQSSTESQTSDENATDSEEVPNISLPVSSMAVALGLVMTMFVTLVHRRR